SHDRSHRTARMEHATVEVDPLLGRLVPPPPPKGVKRLRYDGVQAPKTLAQVKGVMQAARAKVEGVVKGAGQIIARLTARKRYAESAGRDPLLCPHCRRAMGGGVSHLRQEKLSSREAVKQRK